MIIKLIKYKRKRSRKMKYIAIYDCKLDDNFSNFKLFEEKERIKLQKASHG